MNHNTIKIKDRTPLEKEALELGAFVGELYRHGVPLTQEHKDRLQILAKGHSKQKALGELADQALKPKAKVIYH